MTEPARPSVPVYDIGVQARHLPGSTPSAYAGIGVLEVLKEAVNYNRYLADIIKANLNDAAKVVDFGAGAGTFALPLIHSGVDLICVEPDVSLRGGLSASGATVAASLDEIDDESVDLIYTLNVLEHTSDDAATVRLLTAKLKPGGSLLVYVPAFQMLFSSFDTRVGHLRRYDRESLRRLVATAGLQVTRVRYADSLGFFAALLYRWLNRNGGELDVAAVKLYDRFIFPASCCLDKLVSRSLGKNLILTATKK